LELKYSILSTWLLLFIFSILTKSPCSMLDLALSTFYFTISVASVIFLLLTLLMSKSNTHLEK